jgi:prevent-host-death family protein
MIVNATDLKNNLGKYLRDCAKEEVIITSNGRKIARLYSYEEDRWEREGHVVDDGVVSEQEQAFECAPRKVSYEEFLALTEGNDRRYEYIDGEVYLLAAPKTTHQKVLGELHNLFYNWFKGKKCVPILAPFDITLKKSLDKINVVEPDLAVICDLEENLNEKDYYMGVPILVIEILSELTHSKDVVKKFDLYMSTGIKEYWIVNPLSKEIRIYCFDNRGISRDETFKKNETANSYIFKGLNINLKDIF